MTGGGLALPSGGEGTGAAQEAPDLAGLVRSAVRDELDELLPHVLAAVKRDRAFDELSERLSKAERLLATRRERPLAVAVHRFLSRLRHLDFDQAVKDSLAGELVKILADAGFTETGQVGEDYDPDRHDALAGRAVDGKGTVSAVDASGLASFRDVVVRAQVHVTPPAGIPPSTAGAGSPRSAAKHAPTE
jgi:hypothetical protein